MAIGCAISRLHAAKRKGSSRARRRSRVSWTTLRKVSRTSSKRITGTIRTKKIDGAIALSEPVSPADKDRNLKASIRALALYGVLAVSAASPAHADYQTCMQHCMTQHDFDYCQAICAAPSEPESAGNCLLLTDKEQSALIRDFMEAHYSMPPSNIQMLHNDQAVFEVEWRPTDEECRGVVKITADCEVLRHEKFQCEYTGWTRRAEIMELGPPKVPVKVVAAILARYPFVTWDEIEEINSGNPAGEYLIRHSLDSDTSCTIQVTVALPEYHVEESLSTCPDGL